MTRRARPGPVIMGLVAALSLVLPSAARGAGVARGIPFLVPAGDLDGDGRPDVVIYERRAPVDTGANRYTARDPVVSARRGADGAVLWERSLSARWVLPALLGPEAKRGLLVVSGPFIHDRGSLGVWSSDGKNREEAAADTRPVTLTALAANGETTWSRVFEDGGHVLVDVDDSGVRERVVITRGWPRFVNALDARPGPARDALVAVTDRQELQGEVVSRVRAVVVDGADGSLTPILTLETRDVWPEPRATRDLDGDGLDDILVLHFPGERDASAYRGVDGKPLWTAAGVLPQRYIDVSSPGDLTGDGVQDVAVDGYNSRSDPLPGSIHVLLDGRSGDPVLTLPSDFVVPVGDVDEDGRPELLAQDFGTFEPEVSVRYRVLDLDGTVLADRIHALPAPADTGDGAWMRIFGDGGDLDGDGIADTGHDFVFHTQSGDRAGGIAVRVPTLEPAFDGEAGSPLGASLDGHGDDLVLVRLRPGTLTLTAQDGATGRGLWSAQVATEPAYARLADPAFLDAEDVDGDGVLDVIATVILGKDQTWTTLATEVFQMRAWVLSGADGRVLWAA